jgi:allantoicase
LATAAKVLSATDEAFQPASDLLRAHYPQFHPRSFAKSGQLYDGWETRRHNLQTPDSATILLCCPTTVVGVDVCTANFSGNHCQAASVLGLLADEDTVTNPRWVELLAPSETNGNCSNIFDCVSQKPVIAVTLRMYPDGGIARLRIFGHEAESSNALSNPPLELIGKISQIAANFFGSSVTTVFTELHGKDLFHGKGNCKGKTLTKILLATLSVLIVIHFGRSSNN